MSRSGREAADVVELAWRKGARFDAWTECFDENAWREAAAELGLDVAHVAQASYSTSRIMPWEHISMGASRRWLVRERERADRGETTPDFTFGSCSGWGAGQSLGCDNAIAGERMLPERVDEPSGGDVR